MPPDNKKIRELVVISGKGGVGKTSIVASFAALVENAVLADCDVDAADLHLILEPKIRRKEDFIGGFRARVLPEKCSDCGICQDLCRFDAVSQNELNPETAGGSFEIDPLSCEGCGVCAYFCPEEAILMEQPVNGEWYISDTRYGPMVHAKLGVAEENSGKLVSLVRKGARDLAKDRGHDYILVDGAPGVGCPVIASLTGVKLALVVTEPTISAIHDMKRVIELTRHFKIPTIICINKWDLNPELTYSIIVGASAEDIKVAGKIRYDSIFTRAMVMGTSVVEYTGGEIAREIKDLWNNVLYELE